MLIQDSTTIGTSDIHHRELRILVSEGVAVHATVLQLLVMPKGVGLKVLYTALLNLYLVPDFVVWLYQAVGEIGINLILDDLPSEGLILNPLVIDKGRNGNLYRLACILRKHVLPVINIKDNFITFGIDGHLPCPHLDGLTISTKQEIERGDILRDGNIAVVRVDRRQVIALLHVLWSRSAGKKGE